MATFQKRGNKWRAIVRRKGYKPVSSTHNTRAEAQRWAARIEGNVEDQGAAGLDMTVTDMIDRYLDELETHNPPGRTKRASLEMTRRYLGDRRSSRLDAEALVKFARERPRYPGTGTSINSGATSN